MSAYERLISARARLERAAILYVLDAMHHGRDVSHAMTTAAQTIGAPVPWLTARVFVFRRGRERPVIAAALRAAGLVPA